MFRLQGGWQNVGEVKADSPLFLDVTDLTTKKEYKFRVKAVSKIGASEPTPLAKTVLAKDPWGMITKLKSNILIPCRYLILFVI